MKKNNITLFLFLLIGLIAGSLIGQLLSTVEWLTFLVKSTEIRWQPKADLHVLKYDLDFLVKLNLANILGIIAAFWIYRKL